MRGDGAGGGGSARALLPVVLVGALVGASAGVAAHRFLPRSPIVRGVNVEGARVPDEGSTASFLANLAERVRGRSMRLLLGDRATQATLGELGLEVDVAATYADVVAVGHRGSVFRRLRETERARRGGVDVPLRFTFDASKARAFLEGLAPEVAREPVDARLDLAARTKHPDVDGEALDVDASLAAIERAEHVDEEGILLVTKPVRAKVRVSDLVDVDVERVVSAHETTFVTWGVGIGRSANIRNAASKLDGMLLAPGQVLSFNDRVGARTLARGFALAPEIQGDEMTTGVGGGTCQVSTTLHIASLYAGLEILERQAHSHPSAYASLGLDATVYFPSTDLKIRNNLPFPVLVHAFLPKPTAIRVELLGGDPQAKVEYKYGVANAEDFVRRIKVVPTLPPGKRIRHQKGSRGYDVTSFATVRWNDGRIDERHWFSGYRPAPEIYLVAPGTPEGDLPPLPEHAKGVEGRLAEAETYAM